jgi:hypothetical protein
MPAYRFRHRAGPAIAALMRVTLGAPPVRAVAANAVAVNSPPAGRVVSIAGGVGGPGPARRISLGTSCTSAFWKGSLYLDTVAPHWVGGGALIRKISASTGQLTTPAGNLFAAPAGDDEVPPWQQTRESCGVALDSAGDLFWPTTMQFNQILMRAARTGRLFGRRVLGGRTYVIAGSKYAGAAGDGGPATSARLTDPAGLAIDAHGDVIFCDVRSNRVRVIAAIGGIFYGQRMKAGHIYTISGGGTDTGDGELASRADLNLQLATYETGPGLRLDKAGNIVFAEAGSNKIQVIARSSGTFYGQPMRTGHIYAIAGDGRIGQTGNGGPATKATIGGPGWLAIDHAGNVIVAQLNTIRIVAAATGLFYGIHLVAGRIYTLLHLRGYAGCLSVDGQGNLVICTSDTHDVEVFGSRSGRDFGQRVTAGRIVPVAGNGQAWESGIGGPALQAQFSAPFNQLSAIVADSHDDVAFTDNHRVRFVPSHSGTYFGQRMTAGDLYFVPVATAAEKAQKNARPAALAFDHRGNLIVGDLGDGGQITAVADQAGSYYGLRMQAGSAHQIGGGGMSTADGSAARHARISQPTGVSVDPAGNIVVADDQAGEVLVLAESDGTFYGRAMIAGLSYLIAGTGVTGDSGDGGPATSAQVAPETLALDHFGDVLVSGSHNAVRLIAEHTGTSYGYSVSSGDIYTVASENQDGPIRVDSAGNLLFADSFTGGLSVGVMAVTTARYYGVPMTAGSSYQLVSADRTTIIRSALWNPEAIGVVPGRGFAVLNGGVAELVLAKP